MAWPSSTSTQPTFATADGRVEVDPQALIDSPQVSLRALASMLANPVVESNVGAPSPWAGVRRVRPTLEFPHAAPSDVGVLREQFAASISRSLGEADTVVMLVSGGLDSFAVLVELVRQCAEGGRRVVPVAYDLVDDEGQSAVALARRQTAAVDGCPPLVIIPAYEPGEPEPEWSSTGPRSECYTGLTQRIYDLALSHSAPVVLDGEGGDEALAAWNFGTRDLVAGRRFRDLGHYLAAFARHQTVAELAGEGLGLASHKLRVDRSFRWYMASAWPRMLRADPGNVIGARFKSAVEAAHDQWYAWRLAVFRDQEQDWERAMYFDQVHPYAFDAHPLDAPLPHVSPYLDHEFLAYSAGLPWRHRFDSRLATPYWWYKALQMRLIPERLHGAAARYKMRYSTACRRHLERTAPRGRPELVEHGVLRRIGHGDLQDAHGFLPLVVRNTEAWLRGALERGFAVVD